MMKYLVVALLFLLAHCQNSSTDVEQIVITEPKISDYAANDSLLDTHVLQTIEYLKANKVAVDSIYLYHIKSSPDSIILYLRHYNFYAALREIASNNDKEWLVIPPSGYWKGKDGRIIYLTRNDSLIDHLTK